jgi:4-hydroxy-tetrahydrodipicolinate reductase
MNLLVLGKGKMGTVVMDTAQARGHHVESHDEFDNPHGCLLTPERLCGIDVVCDFTTPDAVLENVASCAAAGKNLVVGTTGWYDKLESVREQVDQSGIGFIFGANFSIGVNLMFEIFRAAAPALKQGFTGRITETHHIHKKDAPSGTALRLQSVLQQASGVTTPIHSVREGEVFGIHELCLDSAGEVITLTHTAKSRQALAEGTVRAAAKYNDGFAARLAVCG